jgi:transposase InsO family protein
LKLRHDRGSNYMAEDFQREIAFLGLQASPSFVRQSEGNGVAERFFRTLKEQLLWVRNFRTLEKATGRAARVQDLVQRQLADQASRPSDTRSGARRSAAPRRCGHRPVKAA